MEQLRGGLVDAAALRETLSPLGHGLVLYGHLHVRRHAPLKTKAGFLHAVCASAAPLDHPAPSVRAGFNLYHLGDDGRIGSIEAHVLGSDGKSFEKQLLAAPEHHP